MKRLAIILICMLTCLVLFNGCRNKKGNYNQATDLNNVVEVSIPDGKDNTDVPTSSDDLPDSITYDFKDPDNADSIVITPKG